MTEYDNYCHEMTMQCDNKDCWEESVFIGSFRECIIEAKEEGWRIYKNEDDEWCHICPFCKNKNNGATTVFR